METEADERRPSPRRRYEPVDLQLRVPQEAVAATMLLLQRPGRRESGVLWYGSRDVQGNGTVRYVVAPRQFMTWGNYRISPEALAEVVGRLDDGWKPLAQVHSHPGLGVEHSNYDDRMAISRRVLSLVFPLYGRHSAPFPVGVGVHEWQNDYWHLLGLDQAKRRVVLVTDSAARVEDLR